MYQQEYRVCVLLLLAGNILGEFCYPVFFTKLHDWDNNDSPENSLVNTFHKETLADCLRLVISDPLLLWFLYDKASKKCVTGQCWDVQVEDQMTSNNVLYRKRVFVPRSCSDVKAASPNGEDGEYWIYPDAPTVLGCPTKIYCHNMNTESPTEYLSLPVTNYGVYPNKENPSCDREVDLVQSKLSGTTYFNKIRLNIDNMTVDSYDFTFATSTGTIHPYGFAEDCYSMVTDGCGARGTFQIDTSQTGMVVTSQQTWVSFGFESHDVSMTRSANGRQIHLLCGAVCGDCKPTGDVLLLERNSMEVLPSASARFVIPG